MMPVPPLPKSGGAIFEEKKKRFLPAHGLVSITISKKCGDEDPPTPSGQQIEFNLYIDPSGWVKTPKGAPVVGATVTLLKQGAGGAFEAVPNGSAIMSPSNRVTPDKTDIDGHFGWDVLAGRYKVTVTKAGCTAPGSKATVVASREMDIPPPVTDLDLRLDCPDKKGPKLSALKVKARILSINVDEAAKLKVALATCVPRKGRKPLCRAAKTLKSNVPFSKAVEFTLPKKLKAGPYKATATAVDLAKNKSKPLKRTLKVKAK